MSVIQFNNKLAQPEAIKNKENQGLAIGFCKNVVENLNIFEGHGNPVEHL